MKAGRSIESVESESPPRGLLVAAYTVLLVFLAFCAVASTLPNARLWGINHLAFYPWPIRVLGLAVMAVSLWPPARRSVLRLLAVFSAFLAKRRWITAALLSVAAFAAFVAFASSTNLLGDGLYVENNIERAAKVDSGTFVKVLKDPDPNYPGTEMLTLSISRAAADVFGASPLAVVRVMNALLGALLVFIVAAGCRPRGATTEEIGVPLVVLAFLSGAVQIFFGYIEAYAPLLFLTALFALSAVRTIHRRGGLWAPIVCGLGAAGMHMLGLVLLPPLAVLALWVACGRERTRRFRWGTLALAAVTIAGALFAANDHRLGPSVLALVSRDRSYALLSGAHMADVANEILLVFPGFFALGTVALALKRRGSHSRRTHEGTQPPDSSERGEVDSFVPLRFFGLLFCIPMVLFLLFFKPALGMARDWDLFAITAVPLWVLLYAALGNGRADAGERRVVETVLPPILVMTAVLTSAWIGVNADPARSVARFESILAYDRTNAAYAYETLASHHHNRKNYPAEIKALEKAVEASRNPRYLFTLGLRYYHAEEKEKAIATLATCLRVKPDYAEARRALLQMLLFMGRYDEALVACEEGVRLAPKDPYYPLFMGMAYVRQNRVPEARDAFDRCLRLGPTVEVVNEIHKILQSLPPEPGGMR